MYKKLLQTNLAVAGLLAGQWMYGAESTDGPEVSQAEVRGIGDIRVELRTYGEGEQQHSWTTFNAQDAERARILGSKRLADLLGFGDIKRVTDGTLPGTLLKLEGAGYWLLGVDGGRFHVAAISAVTGHVTGVSLNGTPVEDLLAALEMDWRHVWPEEVVAGELARAMNQLHSAR